MMAVLLYSSNEANSIEDNNTVYPVNLFPLWLQSSKINT